MRILSAHKQIIQTAIDCPNVKADIIVLDVGQQPPVNADRTKCIAIYEGSFNADILAYLQAERIGHLISLRQSQLSNELCNAIRMILDPQKFFKNPLELVLRHEPALKLVGETSERIACQNIVLSNSTGKESLLNEIVEILQNHNRSRTIADSVLAIVDELIMNAVYDAPQAMGLQPNFNGTPYLKPVRVCWGANTTTFAVSVQDEFGSMKMEHVLSKLIRFYALGAAQAINMGPGGAGIGLGLVMEHCSSAYFGIDANQSTTVCCTLPLGKSRRTLAEMQKSVHILSRTHV